MNPLRLYGRYLGLSVRAQMQYRASFLMQATGLLLTTGVEFVAMGALFARFGQLRGWSLAEVALFYGLAHSSFSLAEAFAQGFDFFGGMVKGGGFDRLLVRPRGTVFQLAGQGVRLSRLGRLLQGLAVLGWGALQAGIAWSAAKGILLALALGGGVCLFYALLVLQATLCFWTTESLEAFNTVTYGGVETAQYPLNLYRPWFRRFFLFVVPLGCVNYLPLHALLERADPLGSPPWLQWLAPLLGPLFLLAALRFWNLGVRRYTSTGS